MSAAMYQWVDASNGDVPKNAVVGGKDHGKPTFVGRAKHEGDLLPGKIVPSRGACYVSYGGFEYSKKSYQALVLSDKCQIDWVPQSGGQHPPYAVQGGVAADGEQLYVGRASHSVITIGKIHGTEGCIYVPYGGVEHVYRNYEALVCRPNEPELDVPTMLSNN